LPAGGRGYTRPASLVSLWSTAPFLLNNSVGKFNAEPGVADRLASFQDSIQQMLWPERRDHDKIIGDKMPKGVNGWPLPSAIARTTGTSYLRVPRGYLPPLLEDVMGPLDKLFPFLLKNGEIEIGPIPKDTPVNLLANLDLLGDRVTGLDKAENDAKVLALLLKLKKALKAIPQSAPDKDAQAQKIFIDQGILDDLMKFSKCPDYVVNRGHYFGTSYFQETDEPGLSDTDKLALIEFLKTF
jgi:hypothetical protein